MNLLHTVGEFFSLDVGTTAIRVVQLSRISKGDSWILARYGYAPVDIKIATSDAPEDRRRLGEIILTALGQSGIKTKDVVIGIPSGKVFATVVDLPKMSNQELKTNIKYEAEQFIPMPIEEVKLDYAVLGDSPTSPEKSEVLITSVTNIYNEARLELLEDIGLNVVASEPDSIALIRSVMPTDAKGAAVVFDMGDFSTDVVVTLGGAPRLVRSIPIGLQSLIKAAMQNLNIEHNQAEQFILKFGLAADRLEGQVVRALDASLDQFASEIYKSISFFQNRYTASAVDTILVSGYGASIPLFSDYVRQKTTITTAVANPWQKVQISPEHKEKLATVATQFGVVIGLAQRTKLL